PSSLGAQSQGPSVHYPTSKRGNERFVRPNRRRSDWDALTPASSRFVSLCETKRELSASEVLRRSARSNLAARGVRVRRCPARGVRTATFLGSGVRDGPGVRGAADGSA